MTEELLESWKEFDDEGDEVDCGGKKRNQAHRWFHCSRQTNVEAYLPVGLVTNPHKYEEMHAIENPRISMILSLNYLDNNRH